MENKEISLLIKNLVKIQVLIICSTILDLHIGISEKALDLLDATFREVLKETYAVSMKK